MDPAPTTAGVATMYRVPGADGRLQDRAQNFASRKQAAAHAAQMREIEHRGIGDPHRHDFAGYLRTWLKHHPTAAGSPVWSVSIPALSLE